MYKVVIEALRNENHIDFVKQLRLITTYSLADTKLVADFIAKSVPCTLVAGVDRERADHVTSVIVKLGGAARTETTDITEPMFICPTLAVEHEATFWGYKDVPATPPEFTPTPPQTTQSKQ